MSKRRQQQQNTRRIKQIETNEKAILEYKENQPRFAPLRPRSPTQKAYLDTLEVKRLTFTIGPAGTGKTFLSTSYAVEKFQRQEIKKIVITRPMVGCDEDIGFLPGDEMEKFSAWLDPFMDILEGKLGKRNVTKYMDNGDIIAKPLSFMRGSTFRDSFIILDEAQNTTPGQMKMFLTRLGEGSKAVVMGDIEQTDLDPRKYPVTGLQEVVALFDETVTIGLFEFFDKDITRDPLVREVLQVYRNRGRLPQRKVA